jgi:hypothetical protein
MRRETDALTCRSFKASSSLSRTAPINISHMSLSMAAPGSSTNEPHASSDSVCFSNGANFPAVTCARSRHAQTEAKHQGQRIQARDQTRGKEATVWVLSSHVLERQVDLCSTAQMHKQFIGTLDELIWRDEVTHFHPLRGRCFDLLRQHWVDRWRCWRG